jgi:hypothetical protein
MEYRFKNWQGGTIMNVADELFKLNELLKSGALSQEEFEEQKRRVLDSDNNVAIASDQHTEAPYPPLSQPPPIYNEQPLPNNKVNQKYIRNMVNCNSCGMKIGKNADICPYCGAKKRKTSGCLIAIIVMFVIFGGIGAIASSCDPTTNTEPNSNDTATEEPQLSAEEKAAAEKAEKEAEKKRVKSIKNSISVEKVYFGDDDFMNGFQTGDTNFLNGFYIRIDWSNLTSKTINYAYFEVKFYNTVGDLVSDDMDFRNTNGASLKLTGPFKKGQPGKMDGQWGPYYIASIDKVVLTEVKIEYDDGTIVNISDDDIKYIMKK